MASRGWAYGLTANVVVLSIVSLLTDVSSEMILPILPVFVTTVLMGNALILGFMEGLADGVVAFMKVLSGRWSDAAGARKRFVLAGYGLSTGMKALFPLAVGWVDFLGMRTAERLGKGVRDAPRDALLAESTPQETRGKAFGFHRSMDTTGAIAGPLVTLAILGTLGAGMAVGDAYRLVFLVAAIPAAVSFLVVLAVREPRREASSPRPLRMSFRGAPPALLSFIGIAAVFSLAEFSYAFLLLRAGERGATVAVLLYVLFNVVYAAQAFPAGTLSDRVGRRPVILAGYVAFAAMAGLLALSDALPILLVAFGLYGVSLGMTQGTERALVADLAPADVRATVLGAYHTSVGAVKLASGLLAGALWTFIRPEATFAFGAVAAVGAAVALARWRAPVTS